MRVLMFKVLWRRGISRCPTSCDDDDCKCSVPSEYLQEYGAKSLLLQSSVMDVLVAKGYMKSVDSNDDDWYGQLLKALEHPGNVGEMYTSTTAFDPTFWSVHGSAERLLGLKRILYYQGEIDSFDETWGFSPAWTSTDGDIYLPGRCDWSGVSSVDDLTLPTCDASASCSGHGEDDTMAFSNFLGMSETYTNSKLYDFADPWNDDLPYTYDSFGYDYCNDYESIDFLSGITDSLVYKGYSKTYLAKKNRL